jgi:sugar lactone lactonase YvrE/subtilisin-like proprotein convertase family protein
VKGPARLVRGSIVALAAVLAMLWLAGEASATEIGTLVGEGCIAQSNATGCATTQNGLTPASSVAVSPDGMSAYVVSGANGAIVRFDRDPETGALTARGCIADVPDDLGCGASAKGLGGAAGVAVSPDGKSVYVVAQGRSAIVRFDRDTTTGALTPRGCIADPHDFPGCGVTQKGLGGADGIAVSPDGRSVYVTSQLDSAVVRFDRDTTTGALTPRGCIDKPGDPANCGVTQKGLTSAFDIQVSPDGTSVYAVGAGDDAIVSFARDTATGALTGQGCIADVGDAVGCGATQQGLASAKAVAISPDGRSVYVASSADSAVVRFDRNPTTGALSGAGCIDDVGDADCGTTQQGLSFADGVAVSPDGGSVYVTGGGDDAVARFDRDPASGALSGQNCIDDVGDAAGCGGTAQGLDNADALAVSPDGRSVYVTSGDDGAVVTFGRVSTSSDPRPILLPGSGTMGQASLYPATIEVSGRDTKLADVNVVVNGLSHTRPQDVDMLLRGPNNQEVLLMSDAGGDPVSGEDFVFDDDTLGQMAQGGALVGDSYQPTNYDPDLDFVPNPYCNPGPAGASVQTGCLRKSFRGINPNGTWQLYILDDQLGETGQIAGGWALDITTDVAAPETSITSGPTGTTNDPNPSFAFSAGEAGATFECRLDAAAFTPCTSPKSYSNLADGQHTFAVRASDDLANVESTPAERTFTIDTAVHPPPDSDGDGVPDATDQCPQQAAATATGCPLVTPPPTGPTAGDDMLNGTAGGETICGLAGNDTINGLGGDDTLFGDACNDKLRPIFGARAGTDGNDKMFGAGGNDKMFGAGGNDTLSGGTGNDKLFGGAGNDRLNGGPGTNRYSAGAGNDTIGAKNGKRETIDCGAGKKDKAIVDKRDRVRGCEKVKRARK